MGGDSVAQGRRERSELFPNSSGKPQRISDMENNDHHVCKLCGHAKDLRNSHIFPEFLYKRAYDSIHRAIRLDIDSMHKRYVQKGIREHLLCDCCEEHLSKFEGEFKKTWYDENRIPDRITEKFLKLECLDYNLLKIFHLSILWRCSVATISDFKTVNLGPHEDRIAGLIRSGVAGPEESYRLWGRLLLDDDKRVVHSLVTRPQASKLDGHHVYYACYGGCEWTFLVSSHSTEKYKEFSLRDNGSILLFPVAIRKSNTFRIISEQLS